MAKWIGIGASALVVAGGTALAAYLAAQYEEQQKKKEHERGLLSKASKLGMEEDKDTESNMYSSKKQDKIVVKLIFIGSSGVGKTQLIQRFNGESFSDSFEPTLGAKLSTHTFVERKLPYDIEAQIWDLPGEDQNKGMGRIYLRGSDLLVLVFDVNNKQSFEDLDQLREEFFKDLSKAENTETINEARYPVVVLGNKIDVDESQRQVTKKEAEVYCSTRRYVYLEVSAKSGYGVMDAVGIATANAQAYKIQYQFNSTDNSNSDINNNSNNNNSNKTNA